jgi:hypothetical protein
MDGSPGPIVSSPDGSTWNLTVDNAGAVSSARLTDPIPVPTITLQPLDATAVTGTSVSLTAESNEPADPTPASQWEESTDSGATWHNVGSATVSHSARLTLGIVFGYFYPTRYHVDSSMDGYQYRVTFTNLVGSTTSNVATLTVVPVPGITLPTFSKPVLSQPSPNGPNYVLVTWEETGGSGGFDRQKADGAETVGPYGASVSPDSFPLPTHWDGSSWSLTGEGLPSGVKCRAVNTATGETGAWSEASDPWPPG